ncbi:MAG: hypothetical protein MK135_06225, partial [Polyangiaceae bacterium]|nr:hypothetical protein [Polyangiaceae bacterium]
MTLFRHHPKPRTLQIFSLGAALLMPLALWANSQLEAKYPYDPACSWGRLSNGQGMLHRCLTAEEAQNLAKQTQPPSASPVPKSPQPIPKTEPEKAKPREYKLKVGPIQADEGEITIGALHKPVDRYRSCIDANGGLQGESAKAVVHFLVRGERERAEGVEVISSKGMTREA